MLLEYGNTNNKNTQNKQIFDQAHKSQLEQREYKWAYSEDWVFVFLLSVIMYMEWHKISIDWLAQHQSAMKASVVPMLVMLAALLFLLGNMVMQRHVYYVVRISSAGITFGHVTDRIPQIPKNKLKSVNRTDLERAWVSIEKKAIFLKLKNGSEHRISLHRIKPWQLEGLKLEIEAMEGQHRA